MLSGGGGKDKKRSIMYICISCMDITYLLIFFT